MLLTGCNEAKKESVRITKVIASIKRYNQHTEPYLLCIVCMTGSCKIFSADSYGTVWANDMNINATRTTAAMKVWANINKQVSVTYTNIERNYKTGSQQPFCRVREAMLTERQSKKWNNNYKTGNQQRASYQRKRTLTKEQMCILNRVFWHTLALNIMPFNFSCT